jgi:hypothetical protein
MVFPAMLQEGQHSQHASAVFARQGERARGQRARTDQIEVGDTPALHCRAPSFVSLDYLVNGNKLVEHDWRLTIHRGV